MRPAIAALFLLCVPGIAAVAAQPIPLGPGDRLQIRVYGRPELSGEYRVRNRGDVAVPLSGPIPAAGHSLHDFEAELTRRLGAVFSDAPFVGVEVLEYRPYFILGDVVAPGARPYLEGLTVRKALAVAGGRLSSHGAVGVSALDIEGARETGDLVHERYLADLAEQARLLAERDGGAEIAFPDELTTRAKEPRVAEILADERNRFRARRELLDGEAAVLNKRVKEYNEEIAGLRDQADAARRKQDLLGKQLDDLEALSKRGSVPRTEVLRMRLTVSDADQDLRAIGVQVSRARQGRSRTRQRIVNLESGRADEVTAALAAVQQRLAEGRIRREHSGRRLALMGAAAFPEPQRAAPGYRLWRETEPGSPASEVEGVGPDEPLLPGDVLRVEFPARRKP